MSSATLALTLGTPKPGACFSGWLCQVPPCCFPRALLFQKALPGPCHRSSGPPHAAQHPVPWASACPRSHLVGACALPVSCLEDTELRSPHISLLFPSERCHTPAFPQVTPISLFPGGDSRLPIPQDPQLSVSNTFPPRRKKLKYTGTGMGTERTAGEAGDAGIISAQTREERCTRGRRVARGPGMSGLRGGKTRSEQVLLSRSPGLVPWGVPLGHPH